LRRNFPTQPRYASKIVAIGISTGGPNALQYLFSQIPEDFPGCILVVQHMPEGFTEMFARRLDESSALEVKEAQSGDLLLAGRALICPGNRHMKVCHMEHGDVTILVDQPRVNGHRPSVDVLFNSVAHTLGNKVVGVLMTGMGEDGAAGMGAIQAAGGVTLAQSPDTCVVDSMPRSAISRGFASRVVSLSGLSSVLQSKVLPERPAADQATDVASGVGAGDTGTRRRSS
jgi:two-component system chemotaxis response regulator CheB